MMYDFSKYQYVGAVATSDGEYHVYLQHEGITLKIISDKEGLTKAVTLEGVDVPFKNSNIDKIKEQTKC